MDDLITYMGYEWIQVESDIITIGINDEGLDEFTEILSVNLPTEGETVDPDEVCGEIETEQGPLNLYSPIEGQVIEVNEAVLQRASVIQEDSYGDGWLFRVEAASPEDIQNISEITSAATDNE